MGSRELKTEKIKEMGIEKSREARIGKCKEVEREVKKKDSMGTVSTGSGAAELEAGTEIQVLKSAMKKRCFIRDTAFSDLEDEFEL